MDEKENKHKVHTIKYKHTAVQIIDDLVSKCISIHQACIEANILHFYYSQWKGNIKKFNTLEASFANIIGDIYQLQMGCPSFLQLFKKISTVQSLNGVKEACRS